MKRFSILLGWLLAPASGFAQALPIDGYDQISGEPNGTEIAMHDEQPAPARTAPRAVRHGERTLLLIDEAPPATAGAAAKRPAPTGS